MALPIFSDTRVAMHVSFLISSLPTMDARSLRRALINIVELIDLMNRQQADGLKRLIGEPSEYVKFLGITQHEAHGQCTRITEAVRIRLLKPEAFAIQARFVQTPSEKQTGKFGLVDCVLAASPNTHRNAVTDPLWRQLPAEAVSG